MNKFEIKSKLREAIVNLFPLLEDENNDANAPKKKESNTGKREYADVKRAFEKLGGPSMVDVMQMTGISDDEKGVNRSLFRKKVKQIKNNDTGSYYQFDNEELAQVRAAIDSQQ